MPSSTSSSEDVARLWSRTWIAVASVVVLVLVAWEIFWRSQGFAPSLHDDAMLWSHSRAQATALGSRGVVLVGSSRMQMGIHRETLARETGWPPAVQLAQVRGPSIPVLRHLAHDPDFRATVLCEVSLPLFFGQTEGFVREVDAILRAYDERTLAERIEHRLAMFVQGSLVTRLSRLSPTVIRNAIWFQQMPAPRYEGVIGEDRFRYADYAKVKSLPGLHGRIRRELAQTDPVPATAETLRARFEEVEGMVEAIRERGGEVVFMRLPSHAMVLEREARWYPRSEYWDVFAAQTRTQTIHYGDDGILSQLLPPDGDHLGKNQAVKFTRRLGRMLVEKGIAPGR
ncbi:MAG: hypothetical protein GY733_10550 [bacterium]|nr:hypothetical protein [bacterium]